MGSGEVKRKILEGEIAGKLESKRKKKTEDAREHDEEVGY